MGTKATDVWRETPRNAPHGRPSSCFVLKGTTAQSRHNYCWHNTSLRLPATCKEGSKVVTYTIASDKDLILQVVSPSTQVAHCLIHNLQLSGQSQPPSNPSPHQNQKHDQNNQHRNYNISCVGAPLRGLAWPFTARPLEPCSFDVVQQLH